MLLYLVVSGRACPSMLYHIILGLREGHGRESRYELKGISYDTEVHALPALQNVLSVLKDMVFFHSIISYGGSKGHGKASGCGEQRVIFLILQSC